MKAIEAIYMCMNLKIFFALLVLLNFFYMVFVSPAIFKFCIGPKIEERYQEKLEYTGIMYSGSFSIWGVPPLFMSLSVFLACLGCESLLKIKELPSGTVLFLGKIGYDIKTASKMEIIFSFIGVFNVVFLIAMGVAACMGVYDH